MEALKLISKTSKAVASAARTGAVLLLALGSSVSAQNADSTTTGNQPVSGSGASGNPSQNGPTNSPTQPAASKPWIVRDPATGRVFQQQLVPVTVPVTRWEARTVDQTVYEPRIATQVQQVPQTTYVPNTQYVMQPKIAGWWNPFKQPVQTYQYVPVTSWAPQTQQVPNPVTTQQWVPRQQKIVVYQPVQSTEVRQQLVQTELPQPQNPTAIAAATSPRQPLFRLPILAQQRVLPWPAPTNPYAAPYTAGGYTAPAAPSPAPANQYAANQSNWQPAGQPTSGQSSGQSNVQSSQSKTSSYAATSAAPATYGTYGVVPPQYATSGLRPIVPPRSQLVLPPLPLPRFAASPYSAPLQTTTSVGSTASRDSLQSGMQPTVLR